MASMSSEIRMGVTKPPQESQDAAAKT